MATMPVVAGVDGSQESMHAVEWAALEARRHRAPLRIVSAPALMPGMRANAQVPETVAVRLLGESCRALDEAVTRSRQVTSRLLTDVDLLTGPPALAVTQSGSGALMLVVGARGSGGFAAMVLGSVSRYAAMQARCPVVVVREETGAVSREIVVGIRDPGDTAGALAFAFDEAARRGATLTAVHCWNWPTRSTRGVAGQLTGAEAEEIEAAADLDLTEALGMWHDKYPAVPVRQDVVGGHPARVLACYTTRADLVIIGRHGAPGSQLAVGGVQHVLLDYARGPVVVVPAAD
jgi:nucleotide-binding universal stress UspA family protein